MSPKNLRRASLPDMQQKKVEMFSLVSALCYLCVYGALILFSDSLQPFFLSFSTFLSQNIPAIQKPIAFLRTNGMDARAQEVITYYSMVWAAMLLTIIPHLLFSWWVVRRLERQSFKVPKNYSEAMNFCLFAIIALSFILCYWGGICTRGCTALSNQVHRRDVDLYLPSISIALLYYCSIPFFVSQKLGRDSSLLKHKRSATI